MDCSDYEHKRLAALERLSILDTSPERRFDRLTLILQRFYNVDHALFTIIDEHRQWNKAKVGTTAVEAPRFRSFCDYAIRQDGAFVVSDAASDNRFLDNPMMVALSGVRFYAGVPIREPSGYKIGALCIADPEPMSATAMDLDVLFLLARVIEQELSTSFKAFQEGAGPVIEREELLESALKAHSLAVETRDQDKTFQSILGDIRALTGSGIAFIGETTECAKGNKALVISTSADGLNRESADPIIKTWKHSGWVCREGQNSFCGAVPGESVVVMNTEEAREAFGEQRFPEGLPTMENYMAIPIRAHGQTVGFVGLANRPGGYDTSLAFELTPLIETLATVIERKRLEQQKLYTAEKLRTLGQFDDLTGLPNRQNLEKLLNLTLSDARATGESVAVCFIDVDGFAGINEVFGHERGDQVLQNLAQRLTGVLSPDDVLARLGGDEFVAVIKNVEEGFDYHKLLAALSITLDSGSESLTISGSVGVTVFPQDDCDGDQLIRHADQAMYAAKETGKARVCFFDLESHVANRRKKIICEEVEGALDTGHLILYFQPKLCLKSRHTVGFEALIRWDHPDRGLVPPMDFLPSIASTETDLAVGRFVMTEALATLELFDRKGLDYSLSINLSPHHFMGNDFAEELAELFSHYPARIVRKLTIEVLENTLLDDDVAVLTNLQKAKELGVTVSLDDFGTGFSSLDYFRKLPASEVKIDRSFIQDMLTNSDNAMIVEATIALSHSFKRQVVAEGIECVEVEERLRELGCDQVQGFLYGKPAPLAVALAEAGRSSRAGNRDQTWPRPISSFEYANDRTA